MNLGSGYMVLIQREKKMHRKNEVMPMRVCEYERVRWAGADELSFRQVEFEMSVGC